MVANVKWLIMVFVLAGCASATTPPPPRIALLAPFEGQHRDIGYNALYAARLALADLELSVELSPIDDGGIADLTIDRATALAGDPLTYVVILLPHNPIMTEVQAALADLPALLIGGDKLHPVYPETHVMIFHGGETLLDESFTARYLASDPFAEPPNQRAALVYDATRLAAQAALTGSRANALEFITENIE